MGKWVSILKVEGIAKGIAKTFLNGDKQPKNKNYGCN
jgi:hypothetical protein